MNGDLVFAACLLKEARLRIATNAAFYSEQALQCKGLEMATAQARGAAYAEALNHLNDLRYVLEPYQQKQPPALKLVAANPDVMNVGEKKAQLSIVPKESER